MNTVLILTIQVIFILVFSPLMIGMVRKIKARFQNRVGARITQPYYDLAKLFHKDEVMSKDASWIFRYAPYIVFASTVVVAAGIPLFSFLFINNALSDMLVVIYVLALGTFFLALAGLDTGSGFGGFGASREMTISALAEGGLLFSIFTLAFSAGSTNLFSIAHAVSTLPLISLVPVGIAFVAFVIALLAETGRFPFDNPATHLELTMIHEAMILEYSGKRLALMEWASWNKFLIFIVLGINLFLPWGMASVFSISAIVIAFGLFMLKAFAFGVFIAILESSIAKLRFFRLPDMLFTSFILSIIALSLVIVL
ncbi:MAG: NADH-quinone oxidoreductase subunit H [Candidatus Wildermuthbacteria bacterium]|nr:NADH-quinone oxidoreductase subunit H [Candidatus Wildermuthbacteria bacterium]